MNKTVVVTLRIISAGLLLPLGLRILPNLTAVFPDFKTTPWFVTSLLLFLVFALVAPVLAIISALKADKPAGNIWAWAGLGVGIFASFFPFLGRFAQFRVWEIAELKVDFGLLVTEPRIFQYLFIVRDVGLVVLLVSILLPKVAAAKRGRH
jgi:hypothetical protein